MEMDFLGISGKGEGGEDRGSRQDSGFVGGQAVQWPFSNKISALQRLMSFRTVPDEKSRKSAFDHLSSSGYQLTASESPIESGYRASLPSKEAPLAPSKEAPQRSFSVDRQSAHQFPLHDYQPQTTDTLGASSHHAVSHPSIPVSMSSSFLKLHGFSSVPNFPVTSFKQQPFGGSTANNPIIAGSGTSVPRNVSRPINSSQLTIFYGGSVNVFDDVPLEKAQAIMVMARRSCSGALGAPNRRPETPVSSPIPKVAGVGGLNTNHSLAQKQTQKPTVSVTSHAGSQSRSSSSTVEDVAGLKNVDPMPPVISHLEPSKAMNTPAATMLPKSVPQARKASLARFLEKRKERVTNAMPYSSAKKSPENSTGFECAANISSKCSSADLSLSSNQEESLCLFSPRKA